ncbi:hypothetical protein HYH02_001967 [Chlamydomonas schloesseri]|uniref:SSD domain-containing protein n=1 Tax=Chlamydomonas schloesseri TaxID=2026947 RepID=A0A836BBR5_9CHLO|nr:hypothetical protein HYH02_001967 [Chlamydomonas schloesseri]|eukprot:KAG2453756.1 hypothetical protein HYH02_001967 [Chlamydomonas schloesseri]
MTFLAIAVAALCAGGWARFRIETASDVLWVPQHSKSMKDQDWAADVFSSGGGYAQFMATVKATGPLAAQYGSNALQLAIFSEMFAVDAAVRAITVSYGGRTWSWEDICDVNFSGTCKYSGPLNLWSMSYDTYLAEVNGSHTDPTAGSRDVLIGAVNSPRFPDNSAVSTLSLFGGIVLSPLANPPPGSPPLYISAAQVVSQPYGLRDGLSDSLKNKWYDKFLDILEARSDVAVHSAFAYIAGNSVDNEIGRSVTNDLYLVVISVAIFVLVAVLAMSRRHSVGTRSSLALLGVLSGVLAVVAGYGLSMLFGCPFTTLAQTLPFILLGLTVDVMFILTKGYDSLVVEHPAASMQARFRRLMSTAGTSVVVTLLASAVAFALGAINELPSVRWFSVYATMGVVSILVATLTFYTGVFVLTERRIARNKVDCLCCMTSGGPRMPTAAAVWFEDGTGGPGGSDAIAAGASSDAAYYDAPSAIVLQAPPSHAPAVAAAPSRGAGSAGPVNESTVEGGSGPHSPRGSAARSESASSAGLHPQGGGEDSLKKSAVPDVANTNANGTGSMKQHHAVQLPYSTATTFATPAAGGGGPVLTEEPNLMKKLFATYYAPFLTKWYGKVFVIAIFIGWTVLSAVGAPRLEEGQPLSELAPDDSYLQDYVQVMEDTFQQQIGSPTYAYYRWLDPAPPAQQAKMLAALATSLDNAFTNSTVSAFQGNWLIDFIVWVQDNDPSVNLVPGCSNPYAGRVSGDLGLFVNPATINGCVPEDRFYPKLTQFLEVSRGYNDDLRWSQSIGPNGSLVRTKVWASRMPLVHTAKGDDGSYGRRCTRSIRHLEDAVLDQQYVAENANTPDDVFFLSNGDYIYNEGDALLGPMTLEYVLLAVAGVGLVLTLTLPSIRAVLFMMFAVGLTDFFLFGEMFILGIRFNQVSIINMIMATGLAVDYSVYFAQRFVACQADGTLNGRMSLALADTGSAVFVGGITALLGTIPLAFSTSTILRTFFSLIFGTIAFALLIGLMLMPVVFSLIGPAALDINVAADGTVKLEQDVKRDAAKRKEQELVAHQQQQPPSGDWRASMAAVRADAGAEQQAALQAEHRLDAKAGANQTRKGEDNV